MRDQELVNKLREHAEWQRGNEWETPITLGDDLVEAADRNARGQFRPDWAILDGIHRAHDYGEGRCHDDGAAENRTDSGQPGNGRLLR